MFLASSFIHAVIKIVIIIIIIIIKFIQLGGERYCEKKRLAQKHHSMSPARARTRTARSGNERTNHKATAPPDRMSSAKWFTLHLNIFKSSTPTSRFYLLASSSILQDVCRHRCCCTAGCTVVMFGDINVLCIVTNTSVEFHGIGAVNMKNFEGVYCN